MRDLRSSPWLSPLADSLSYWERGGFETSILTPTLIQETEVK